MRTAAAQTLVTLSLTVNLLMFMALGGRTILIANPRDTRRVLFILRNERSRASRASTRCSTRCWRIPGSPGATSRP
uniref:Uncharacterized protein n=1 Tax=Ralstonia solanacearum TaxID=305 RepID=A0A0S4TQE7_RALSL|nr:exported protein of unknown function [Ralstonia solanacearum]